jgi:acyl-CoA thioester hydrolase
MKSYEKFIEVRWADNDPNGHVQHSAYYEYAAHVRIRFFAELGYDSVKRNELQIGPILFKEECSFIREIRPDDVLRVNMLRGDLSDDGSKWVIHHEIFDQHDEKKAHITVRGAWMDLNARRLTIPPQPMSEALQELPEGEDYVYRKK